MFINLHDLKRTLAHHSLSLFVNKQINFTQIVNTNCRDRSNFIYLQKEREREGGQGELRTIYVHMYIQSI